LHLDTVTAHQSATAGIARSSAVLWIGIGCKRGTSAGLIHHAFDTVCRDYSLNRQSIAGVATLKGKEAEAGLLEFCQTRQWPISFLSAAELRSCPGLHPSARVEVAVETPSVAESAALFAAVQNGTVPRLVVPKQSFQWSQDAGAVTLAIAQSIMYPEFSSPDVF
jgi:cobalt-precorrin 5A hydrolase / precorrin-3B C17-methyltransferase